MQEFMDMFFIQTFEPQLDPKTLKKVANEETISDVRQFLMFWC